MMLSRCILKSALRTQARVVLPRYFAAGPTGSGSTDSSLHETGQEQSNLGVNAPRLRKSGWWNIPGQPTNLKESNAPDKSGKEWTKTSVGDTTLGSGWKKMDTHDTDPHAQPVGATEWRPGTPSNGPSSGHSESMGPGKEWTETSVGDTTPGSGWKRIETHETDPSGAKEWRPGTPSNGPSSGSSENMGPGKGMGPASTASSSANIGTGTARDQGKIGLHTSRMAGGPQEHAWMGRDGDTHGAQSATVEWKPMDSEPHLKASSGGISEGIAGAAGSPGLNKRTPYHEPKEKTEATLDVRDNKETPYHQAQDLGKKIEETERFGSARLDDSEFAAPSPSTSTMTSTATSSTYSAGSSQSFYSDPEIGSGVAADFQDKAKSASTASTAGEDRTVVQKVKDWVFGNDVDKPRSTAETHKSAATATSTAGSTAAAGRTSAEWRSMQSGADVVEFLKDQHQQIKSHFDRVMTAQGDEKQQAFVVLRKLLAVHETAEEMIVHPVARTGLNGGESIVAPRLKEEHDAKQLLAKLEEMDVCSTEFNTELAKLQESVVAHAEAEERHEFDKLVLMFDKERLQQMRVAAEYMEAIAPTRPHAGVDSAAANIMVGPFAAMIDRVRDAFTGKSG